MKKLENYNSRAAPNSSTEPENPANSRRYTVPDKSELERGAGK